MKKAKKPLSLFGVGFLSHFKVLKLFDQNEINSIIFRRPAGCISFAENLKEKNLE